MRVILFKQRKQNGSSKVLNEPLKLHVVERSPSWLYTTVSPVLCVIMGTAFGRKWLLDKLLFSAKSLSHKKGYWG